MSSVDLYYKSIFAETNSGPVNKVDSLFEQLRTEVPWVQRDNTPRQEYYHDRKGLPYTYGSGRGVRTYESQPLNRTVGMIMDWVSTITSTEYDVAFLNRYLDENDQLGWHADDSPELDDDRPIAIVSFGGERNIMFRKNLEHVECHVCKAKMGELHRDICSVEVGVMTPATASQCRARSIQTRLLEHGSLSVMPAGMQNIWEHKIPKAGHPVGERISITLRGRIYA